MKLTWKKRYWLWVIVLVLAIAASVGPIMSDVEIAPYEVESTDGAIEIRRYPDLVVAEVMRKGERMEAINDGFPPLADYIFGANKPGEAVAMTAPVTQQKEKDGRSGQTIAMTAPVIQQSTELGEGWKVRFVMPRHYSLADLPEPKNEKVKLIEQSARKVVAIRFAGRTDDANVMAHLEKLKAYVAEKELTVSGEPVFAFYNPPWTLPFLRRNEIWWELQDTSGASAMPTPEVEMELTPATPEDTAPEAEAPAPSDQAPAEDKPAAEAPTPAPAQE